VTQRMVCLDHPSQELITLQLRSADQSAQHSQHSRPGTPEYPVFSPDEPIISNQHSPPNIHTTARPAKRVMMS
jgi:hypothetical protein